jgi:Na+/glutamate symporter
MHITLIIGAFFVMQTRSATPLLVVLVTLKVILDVLLHVRTHKKLGTDYNTDRIATGQQEAA